MAGNASRLNGMKGGRKKGYKAINAEKAGEYIAQRVSKELEPIITVAIEQAKGGDQAARRDLLDRAYGRPKETIEMKGEMKLKLDV